MKSLTCPLHFFGITLTKTVPVKLSLSIVTFKMDFPLNTVNDADAFALKNLSFPLNITETLYVPFVKPETVMLLTFSFRNTVLFTPFMQRITSLLKLSGETSIVIISSSPEVMFTHETLSDADDLPTFTITLAFADS